MCIPSCLSYYVMALHCLISWNHILDNSCKHMADMWLTVCCWRSIIKCVSRKILCFFHTLLKYLIFFPEIQNLLFSVYEIQFGRYFFVHVVLPFFLFNVCKILLNKLFYKVKKASAAKRTKAQSSRYTTYYLHTNICASRNEGMTSEPTGCRFRSEA